MSIPILSDIDHEGEAEDISWEHYRHAARHLDAGELIERTLEQLRAESADTSLNTLIEGWMAEPEWDWDRIALTPMFLEALGKYVAVTAAKVVGRAIEDAVARNVDRDF